MSKTPRKTLAIVAIGLVGMLTVGACGGSDSGSTNATTDGTNPAGGAAATVIDVRTPEEFAAGHLAGAVNINVQADDFDAKIGALDPEASYVVYCRSGNRSGVAVDRMSALGFTHAVNAGSLESAAESTGLDIVT